MAVVALDLVVANLNKHVIFKTPVDITVFDLCRHIQSSIKNAGHGPGWGMIVRFNFIQLTTGGSYIHVEVATARSEHFRRDAEDASGITNHEEYSLIHEKGRTQTLRRPKNAARDYDKLETLKHKLQTDDGANWLPHAKTFRQLGIEETDNLLLQRKYFFSDQNIGARDPVQLNLLFIQLKEAILNGAHPISLSQAIELAGLQCQAEMGNFIPEKAKSLCIECVINV
ncbi:unnamed protein product [Hydatigera taeniaeformis]|uniref:FERM domain-containing protein n=1 Tax=Hydatigena taeniaeformis TaxID=6205 RepID=A0A0R3WU41_HYDTA|nr:unnamed protein product [Hydatigera taeniaeformis]